MKKAIIELYRKATTKIPQDIKITLEKAKEKESGIAREILREIIGNIKIAKKDKKPLCQDTGTPIFYINYPFGYSQTKQKKVIEKATFEATKKIPLRINAVDVITNKHLNKNYPIIYFKEWRKNFLEICLLLKGAGSENMAVVYKLPDYRLKAERNLEGIRKCVIDAVFNAQGLGCPPYIIGVGVSGLKQKSQEIALQQFLRKVDDNNKNPILDYLEKKILRDINKLGIGPMGLGGRTTALAVKIGTFPRHPASYFVVVNFMCWALRRSVIRIR